MKYNLCISSSQGTNMYKGHGPVTCLKSENRTYGGMQVTSHLAQPCSILGSKDSPQLIYMLNYRNLGLVNEADVYSTSHHINVVNLHFAAFSTFEQFQNDKNLNRKVTDFHG